MNEFTILNFSTGSKKVDNNDFVNFVENGKGQLISKGLFGFFNSPKKGTKN